MINTCNFSFACRVILVLAATFPASAQFYKQTNLVSDLPGLNPLVVDKNLVNPWGVSRNATSPFWVSDAGTNVSTLYSVDPTTGAVAILPLVVSVPGGPTGQVFNPGSADFLLSPGNRALFIFAGLNGAISGWNSNVPAPGSSQATPKATGAPPPAVYTGLALGSRPSGQHLYAANPAAGRIDVFNTTFTQVAVPGGFIDPTPLPANDTPFNVVNINGNLYVSYTGPTGVINVFDTDGNFIKRFAAGAPLANPWGMVVAPPDFGMFSNALLVGNFNGGNAANGPGRISAFNLTTGAFLGQLKGTDGALLAIDGLWQLIFGNGGMGGNPSVMYFAAGIENELHGLFGSLSACGPRISGASASPNVLWPPNNKFEPVTIAYSVADDCDPAPVCSLSVTSDENPGQKTPDAIVMNAHTVDLRASRNGNGDGRVYTVTIGCTDKLPLSSSASVRVTVPHDQGH